MTDPSTAAGHLPLVQVSRRQPLEVERRGGSPRPRTTAVALVCMPFASAMRPSIQVGLLAAQAERAGFVVDTFHLNLELAAAVGVGAYESLCEHRGRLVAEWVFSPAAFGPEAPDPSAAMLAELPDALSAHSELSAADLLAIRETAVPAYLERMLSDVDWGRYSVVGFTSTFQQNVATIAMARCIKQRYPDVTVVVGGANVEGDMGRAVFESCPVFDYVFLGEADTSWPAFLDALDAGRQPALHDGLVGRHPERLAPAPPAEAVRPPVLDDIPVPRYEEYFERMERLGLMTPGVRRAVSLPFESARGCWWGAKRHCTFCGLNGGTISFRAKSADRVAGQLAEMARRYRTFHFSAVDNIIDTGYLDTLMVQLCEDRADYDLFYEVKSNLSRADIRRLREGGVRRIQPGIESFSPRVLRLMRKGVRASQNVNFLRWSSYYGMEPSWNVLWGFPGERPEDYREQAELTRLLVHLPPPHGGGRIWMERYSPLFMDRDAFPVRYVRPEASYAYVYPAGVDLERMAYFFDYELEERLDDEVYEPLREALHAWGDAWKDPSSRPTLTSFSAPGYLVIEDNRNPRHGGSYVFEEPLAAIYLACGERAQSAEALRLSLGLAQSPDEIEAALEAFCDQGLMMRDGRIYLSLALPAVPGR